MGEMKIFLNILGSVCIVYGLGVNVLVTSRSWFNWIFCIIGAFLIALGCLWKYVVKLPLWTKAVLLVLLALCLSNFIIAETRIIRTARSVPDDDAKWVVILGAKVNDSGVSLEFARRIDAAAEFLKKNPGSVAVTTGGKGDDEPVSEGEVAAERLMSLGVEKERILVEKASESTRENFEFAKAVMEANGYEDGEEIIIVSSAFHLYRASKIAEVSGFDNISYMGVRGKLYLLPQYYLREYAAIVFESVKDYY